MRLFGPKSQKYGAIRVKRAGLSFASQGEANLYEHLLWLERAGKIRAIRCQVSVYLTKAKILYKPDFSFVGVDTGELIYAEFKGFETPEWRIKRRLWMHYGPGRLQVFKGGGAALRLVEEIRGASDEG
ncbi:MAG: DUF1064 domain-containing protein [Bdellovibrionaceae bacterium]|nr:DUF1064 domain-containing protein [Pseudobdellovibrionaceae bacterium]